MVKSNFVLWESGIEDFEKVDKELLKFYFDQTEKSLKSTLDLADKISNRAYALLAVIIPLLSIIIANLTKNYFGSESLSCNLLLATWIFFVPTITSFLLLINVVFPKNYSQLGREPQYIVKEEYYNNPEYQGELSYKLMLNFEIEDYQHRITYMDNLNNRRVNSIKWAFKISLISFVLLLASLIYQLI